MLIDYRCPQCNRTVDGKSEEVREVKNRPKAWPKVCKHCWAHIELSRPYHDGLGEECCFKIRNS